MTISNNTDISLTIHDNRIQYYDVQHVALLCIVKDSKSPRITILRATLPSCHEIL
jgi:hypothetical protein